MSTSSWQCGFCHAWVDLGIKDCPVCAGDEDYVQILQKRIAELEAAISRADDALQAAWETTYDSDVAEAQHILVAVLLKADATSPACARLLCGQAGAGRQAARTRCKNRP